MADLDDGQSVEMQGSGAKPYVLTNTGGVYSCTCPAWRNQSHPIDRRTCKHLRALRGDAAETERVGGELPARPERAVKAEEKAPPVLLAERWDNVVDLEGWWMSEKLDGVRAWWDGERFQSRLGNPFYAPDWFLEGLPRGVVLDGELWAGRKKFQRAVSIVRRADAGRQWEEIKFLVFDAPNVDGPFEDRLEFCLRHLGEHQPPYAMAHEHQRCRGLEHLREELARVEEMGGEGLMLRKPGSRYVVGRSHTLLKVKSFRDTEGRVVEHLAGAGRHAGRLGAIVVEMENGTRVSVGTGFSDAERESPPPIGTLITFRYQELSDGGVPRFPSYVGVRDDVEWARSTEEPREAPTPVVARPAPPPVATPVPAPSGSATARRFEFSDGKSNKFWEVSVDGSQMTVTFGRIGTAGQTQAKTFANESAAAREADKLITEKLRKGYHPI